MTKFTPGPWHLEDSRGEDNEHLFWEVLGDSKVYCGYLASLMDSEHIGGTSLEERDANALLVCAAPEMYEELEDSIKDLKFAVATIGSRYPDRAMEISKKLARKRTLLAKARGEE